MTWKEKYHQYILEKKEFPLVEKIAFTIFRDVESRSGMLDGVDEDVQEEILENWMKKINKIS